MKIKVVVVVFNRLENLKNWIRVWNQCDKMGANLTVIHNYENINDIEIYKKVCEENSVKYISRKNIGFDIGAFQDVCCERLLGFDNNWQLLYWSTDDTIIMRKDFLKVFTNPLTNPKIGVTCLELSNERQLHVRTSGFCIKKDLSKRLKFPTPIITTKEQCYQFEHRSNMAFLNQVKAMGLNAIMPLPLPNAAAWDIEHRIKLNRMDEHNIIFKKDMSKKVTIICPIFNEYPQIISSMICQTHKNWELILIHDGENTTGLREIVNTANEPRITYLETVDRVHFWGHPIRQWALNEIKENRLGLNTDYVVITNGDNYHVPTFLEYLVKGFQLNANVIATYCSDMVHSYSKWKVIECSIKLGYVDCAGVMVKKEVACDIGWADVYGHSSDWTYFDQIAKKFGVENFVKVTGCLLIHN